ncbi:transposase family protein [Kolteria novifilia]
MSKDVRAALEEVITHFEDLEAPRSSFNHRHLLVSVMVIAVMGLLAGASGPTGIAKWARMKKDLLLGTLELPNGIPAKDVFRRSFRESHLVCADPGPRSTQCRGIPRPNSKAGTSRAV